MKVLKKTTVVGFALIFFQCFMISCENNSEADISTLSSIEISTGKIYPNFSPEIKDYYITSLNTLNTIEITINDFTPLKTIYINNVKVKSKITGLKLKPGEDIVVKSVKNNKTDIYTIHYLPLDLPKINVITKNSPSNGFILVNLFELSSTIINDFSYIAILDNNGYPVYYKKLPYKAVINFKYFNIGNNQKRFSYNVNDLGKVVVMNEKFEEIKQLEILPHNGHGSYPIDNHDFIYINDNHYVIPGIITRKGVDLTAYGGKNAVDLTELIFQEVVNNQVIFEWNSSNYPELLSAADPIYYNLYATNSKVDYFHFNAICIDPNDQNFVISARHTNQIYKINRTTGAIMWRFGGNNDDFKLTGNKIISHPHHCTILSNGNLLLFDNGVTKSPQQTRIAEFALDENNKTANLVYECKSSAKSGLI